jgi:site-specific DNA-adenine methylase
MTNFLTTYYGRKKKYENKAAPIPEDIDKIIEPFGGTFSYSQYYYENVNKKMKFIYNDIDKSMCDIFTIGKTHSEDELRNLCPKIHENRDKIIKRFGEKRNRWCYHPKYMEFIQKADIEVNNENYNEILNRYQNDTKSFVYLDPPYFSSYNLMYIGYNNSDNTIDNTKMIVDCCNFIKECTCKCCYICNNNALMRYLLNDTKIHITTYEKSYTARVRKGQKVQHIVACNY